ncbi:hypothetical protein VB636_11180, partial [Paracoccus sp. APAP_BH8]|uniref:hypothetical protein n=1 Tax=Paracoccus sp. APAP_BH8 TaxID=3110237 RepID=UPI002FD867E2
MPRMVRLERFTEMTLTDPQALLDDLARTHEALITIEEGAVGGFGSLVEPTGAAADKGLAAGDVITEAVAVRAPPVPAARKPGPPAGSPAPPISSSPAPEAICRSLRFGGWRIV